MTLSTQPADTDLLVPLPGPDEPIYRNLWAHIGKTMPKKGRMPWQNMRMRIR